jgi:hypothetical protein
VVTFASITVVFFYTSITNTFERPEGSRLRRSSRQHRRDVTGARALRSTELRVLGVEPDDGCGVHAASKGGEAIRIIASRSQTGRRAIK